MSGTSLIIPGIFLIALSANSQDPILLDSSIHSFTVKPCYDGPCTTGDAVRFDVLSERTKFVTLTGVYVATKDISPIKVDKAALYTISGYLATKKEWVSGC